MYSKRTSIFHIIIVLATVTILLGVGSTVSKNIKTGLQQEIQETLRNVSEQNITALQQEMHTCHMLLEVLAERISKMNINDNEQMTDVFDSYVDVYHFKRIGYIFSDGTALTTDGYKQDLSFRDFFQQGMNGEAMISGTIMDTIGKQEPINVISVPVYDKKKDEPVGVLFATYQTAMFQSLFSMESFEGKGYSCIVKADGTIIANSEQSPIYGAENFFDYLSDADEKNVSVLKGTQIAMERGSKGEAAFAYGKEYYFYYEPIALDIKIDQWFLVTIVPTEVMDSRLSPVMQNINLLIYLNVLILMGAFVLYIYTYHVRRRQLEQIAYQDPVTGGDNYANFKEKMRRRRQFTGYVVSMDISEFKIINSVCGMEIGDETLRQVWNLIKSTLKESELAAHVNADSFVMFYADQKQEDIEARVMELHDQISALAEQLNIPRIMPYFGICQVSTREEVEEQFGCANEAKKNVKGNREQIYGIYHEEDFHQIRRQRDLEDSFEEAIEKHQFEVWYQPKYRAADEVIDGAEALVRWRRSEKELVSPGEFIPLFEKNGMISVLDAYMFEEVCRQQKKWLEQGMKLIPVSVNISRATLYYPNVAERYVNVLKKYELTAKAVQLEITESAMQDNAEIQEIIKQFHQAGFELLLDDFGNGYSSLSTLNMVHFDILKLDKGLVDHIGDSNGEKLLHYTIELAKSMGIRVTAEGVEYKEQFDFLQKLNCNDIQGYYFSKPLPKAEYQKLLRES